MANLILYLSIITENKADAKGKRG